LIGGSDGLVNALVEEDKKASSKMDREHYFVDSQCEPYLIRAMTV
jgi:hypothetical protein